MRIMYIHGIGSNGKGNTVTWLNEKFKNHEIFSFDIPFDPEEAMEFIKKKCNELDINMVIGTSLGGFYAMMIDGVQKILINPAIRAYEIGYFMGYGEHEYLGEREDKITTYYIDEEYVQKLKKMYFKHMKNLDEEMVCETYAIFGSEDEVCDFRADFEEKYRKSQMIVAKFGHRMTEEVFDKEFTEIFEKAEKDYNTRVW